MRPNRTTTTQITLIPANQQYISLPCTSFQELCIAPHYSMAHEMCMFQRHLAIQMFTHP